MTGWTPLFQRIVCSSLWDQDDHVRLAWVTMLAISTREGMVPLKSPSALARMARIDLEKAQDAIRVLSSPDPAAPAGDLEEGRRIVACPTGWKIVKWTEYRDLAKSSMKREANAGYQETHREKNRKQPEAVDAPPAQGNITAHDPFDLFWLAYPLKKGKEDARKAFVKALKKTKVETILAAVAEQQGWPEWKKEDGKFIPHPATWLNRGGWADEAAPGPDKRFAPGTDIAYFTAPIQPGEEDPFKAVREAVLGDEAKS